MKINRKNLDYCGRTNALFLKDIYRIQYHTRKRMSIDSHGHQKFSIYRNKAFICHFLFVLPWTSNVDKFGFLKIIL